MPGGDVGSRRTAPCVFSGGRPAMPGGDVGSRRTAPCVFSGGRPAVPGGDAAGSEASVGRLPGASGDVGGERPSQAALPPAPPVGEPKDGGRIISAPTRAGDVGGEGKVPLIRPLRGHLEVNCPAGARQGEPRKAAREAPGGEATLGCPPGGRLLGRRADGIRPYGSRGREMEERLWRSTGIGPRSRRKS